MSKHKYLNLGCGFRPRPKEEGWLNTDFDSDCNPDMVFDITKEFPFEDNTFDYIYASHILEHITGQEVYHALRECWRVLKSDGVLEIIAPYYLAEGAFDLDHKSVITIRALKVFEPNYRSVASKERIVKGCHYKIIEAEYDAEAKKVPNEPQVYVKMKKVVI